MDIQLQEAVLKLVSNPDNLRPLSHSNSLDLMMQGYLDLSVCLNDMHRSGPKLAMASEETRLCNQVRTPNPQDYLDLNDFLEFQEEAPLEEQLKHSIVSMRLSEYQLELAQNRNKELESIESCLGSMLEQNQISIANLSQNNLTSVNTYSYDGQLLGVDYMAVPIENKRHTDEDVLNKMPHPVRMNLNRKQTKQKEVIRKPASQILQEFSILSGMLNIQQTGKHEEEDYQKVLDVLSLQENTEYNDLWEEILCDINVGKERPRHKPAIKVKDEQFDETIERLIKEGEEDEEEFHLEMQKTEIKQLERVDDRLPENDGPQEVQEQKPAQIVMEELPTVDDSEVIKISGGKIKYDHERFQFALEDESDLANFYDELPREKFAIQYPFELDPFQKRAILHLEKKESVFVAAHTSAGKTVIAEYGIALAMKHKRKVVYTSPIKALSNQKYREFVEKFGSVGIVTGDISLNQQASCVIMTTEILRNSLYKGADMIRDIEWVIFDEVHYINNQQRGVVWEETFIMLPQHIGIIMLSATVPNYMEFANWVGRTKRRKIHVIKTLHRPVPLEHSLFMLDKFHVIKEATGNFLRDSYHELRKQINNLSLDKQQRKEDMKAKKKQKLEVKGFWNDNRRQQQLKQKTLQAVNKFIKNVSQGDVDRYKDREQSRTFSMLIEQCQRKNLLPCVIFCFSKKRIEALVKQLFFTSLNTNQQKHQVIQFFNQALSNLKMEDKHLDQFRNLAMYAEHGYAIHHGDLLPLAKEIVELLFSQGLIKVLLATETFAMGINMPTKTVIFHSIKKFDGSESDRFLNSSEYVQMSGRAGRRGLDEKGTVVIMVKDPNQLPEPADMAKMMDNPGELLTSKFRVTYQIILNLYTSKQMNVESMMRQSFIEDEKFSAMPTKFNSMRQYKKEYDKLGLIECPFNQLQSRLLIEEYMVKASELRQLNEIVFSELDYGKIQLPKFGRVLGHNNEAELCMVLKIDLKANAAERRFITVLVIDEIDCDFYLTKQEAEASKRNKKKKKHIVLEYENSKQKPAQNGPIPNTNNQYFYYVHNIQASELLEIYNEKVQSNSKSSDFGREAYQSLAEQLLNPPKKLQVFGRGELMEERSNQLRKFTEQPCHACEFKEVHTVQNTKRRDLKHRLTQLTSEVDKNDLVAMGSFEGMLTVLKKMKFVSEESILLKGRIAREVDVYVAEILIEAVLNPLDPMELAALLSGFVNQYREKDNKRNRDKHIKQTPKHPKDTYTDNLTEAIDKTIDIVRKFNIIEMDNKAFPVNSEDDLLNSILNFHLARTVYDWATGMDFIDICRNTDAPEGAIVKTIMRLDILFRNLKSGCNIIGNTTLVEKIEAASQLIKRDIVFAQSLYIN